MGDQHSEQPPRPQQPRGEPRPGGQGGGHHGEDPAAAARQREQQEQQATMIEAAMRQQAQAREQAQRQAEAQARAQQPARGAEPTTPSPREPYLYPERVALPSDTGHAIDRARRNLITRYLGEGEVRTGWGRGTLPLAIGLGAEGLKGTHIWSSALGGRLATGLGSAGTNLDKLFGFGATKPLETTLAGIGAGTQIAALATGILMPSISLAKRVLLGENAWKVAAKYSLREGEGGFFAKIIRGAESKAIRGVMLKENKSRKQLLRMADQGADLSSLQIGSRNKINDLIAEGVVAGSTVQLMHELGASLSAKDQERLERARRAYDVSKRLFDTHIPTVGQREQYVHEILPGIVRNKERALWAKQTAWMTGIGVVKSATMVGMLELFSTTNVSKLIAKAGPAVQGFGNWLSTNIVNLGQFAGQQAQFAWTTAVQTGKGVLGIP